MWFDSNLKLYANDFFFVKNHFFLSSPYLLWVVAKTLVSSSSPTKEGWFRVNFWPKSTHLTCFSWNKWFHIYFVFLSWFRRLNTTLFCSSSLCGVVCLFCFVRVFVQFRLSDQLQLITLASSMLQTQRYGYSRNLNIVICVGFFTLSFYAINMNVVSLFAYSSFLFLVNLLVSMYSINLNKWISFIFYKKNCQKKVNKNLIQLVRY